MTEEIRGAARLITGFLSSVGNKILITPHDAPGSSRQMDVGFSAVLTPLAGRHSQQQPAAWTECVGRQGRQGSALGPVVSLRDNRPLGPATVGKHV